MALKEISFFIKGMHCASCVAFIENSLNKVDGIKNITINLATETSKITFDEHKININQIKEKIEKLGYKVEGEIFKNNEKKTDDKSYQNEKKEKIFYEKEKELFLMWQKFFISAIFSLPLLYIAMVPMFNFVKLPFPEKIHPMYNPLLYAIIQIILTSMVLLTGGKNFYINGLKAILNRAPNMDTLVTIGTLSAFLYSIYSTIQIYIGNFHYVHNLYYETVAIIITLIILGKTLEITSKNKATLAIKKLIDLSPKKATIIDPENQSEKEIFVEDLKIGDIVKVKPGEKIATDGIIINGHTSIDESILTGESIPVEKTIGDKVIGGSINKNGSILFKVEKIGKETFLAQIIKLVEEAQNTKAPIAKLADKVAVFFVPVVILIAIISFILWFLIKNDFIFPLKIFMSVLLIACPCALGLATPIALIVGIGKGAENGILIKNGEALEVVSKINTIVFDKTGTLTYGKPIVTDIYTFDKYDENELLKIVASIENHSEHPLADAIVNEAKNRNLNFYQSSNFISYPGLGVECLVENKKVLAGNINFLKKHNIKIDSQIENKIEKLEMEGKTTIYISIDNIFSGAILCKDIPKKEAKDVINLLKKYGIKTIILTGDKKETAKTIAKELDIDIVIAEVLPDEKTKKIKELMAEKNIVAMVGDGINDSPSLATANVGIAIGAGTDVAIESADIVLIHSKLDDILKLIKLSKYTLTNIKENLFWAFFYNLLLIPVAAGILSIFNGPILNPIFASIAMSLSSISVVLNALRLKYKKL